MEKVYDVLTSGYVSMDHMLKIQTPARVGYTSIITNRTNTKINYGGCGVNIACDLSRLGMKAMPMIRVGDDYEQIGFAAFLKENGICTDAVKRVPGEITSVCYLVQDTGGQHITLYYPGSMDGKYAEPLEDKWFLQARLGVVTVGARCDNEEFLQRCKKNNLPLVFSMKGDMEAFPKDFLYELLHYCTIIFTNESERDEIEQLFGIKVTDLLTEGNAKIVVTTLGKNGSVCYAKQGETIQEEFVPICKCGGDIVVDTTGSGDAFVAGFLWGYLSGEDLRRCAMAGTVLSSYVIEKEGCCTNAPSLELLQRRLSLFEQELKPND